MPRSSEATTREPATQTEAGSRGRLDLLLALAAGALAFIAYWLTLAPSIVEGDSAEVVTAVYLAGVPHPTGYPLYAILGHLWLQAPWSNPAFGLNLLSALFAASAVGLTYLLARRITHSRPAALTSALLFGLSRTFWSQAVVAEVYTLHLLFVVAVLSLVLAWDVRGNRHLLRMAALLYGLSFTHHLSSVLLAPALLYLGLTSRHRLQLFRELVFCLPLFLAPLALYAYLPWAAARNTPANWGDPSNWHNFLFHVTGRQYSGRMFQNGPFGLWAQFSRYLTAENFLPSQYPWLVLPLALLGMVALWRWRRRSAVTTLLVYGAGVFWAVNYSITDVEVYYLVPHLMVALWSGAGLRMLLGWLMGRARLKPSLRTAHRLTALLSVLALPGWTLLSNVETCDRHDHWSTLVYGRAALDSLKPNALVIGDGDSWWFPVLYARHVEGRRPDVVLASYYDLLLPDRVRRTEPLARAGVSVQVPATYPVKAGSAPSPALLREVLAANVGQRPVYLLGEPIRMAREEEWMREVLAPYRGRIENNVNAYELSRGSLDVEPSPASGAALAAFDADSHGVPSVALTGCKAVPGMRSGLPWLTVEYQWRLQQPAPKRQLEVRAIFADADGNYTTLPDGSIDFNNFHPLGQGLPTQDPTLGKSLKERFTLHVPPGSWNRPLYLWLGVVEDGKFLKPVNGSGSYVRIGRVPEVAMDHTLLREGPRQARR